MPKQLTIWLNNYLSNRQFYVKFKDKQSNHFNIHSGVLQGAVLSPTLLNLFIRNMTTEDGSLFLYSDDISVVLCHKMGEDHKNQIKKAINYISSQVDNLGLSISSSKTQILYLPISRNNDIPDIPDFPGYTGHLLSKSGVSFLTEVCLGNCILIQSLKLLPAAFLPCAL